MKVLITGASGLIGGRLIRHLLAAGGVEIHAASRVQRVWPDGVWGTLVDFSEPRTLEEACENADAVVNLASMSEAACAGDPYAALRANGGGTLTLVSAAARAQVPRFVQVSTNKVYGNNPVGTITEDSPGVPQSHYAITHRLAEDYARSQHVNSVIFRLANGFGAPVTTASGGWDVIINGMCREAVLKRQITIRSSGRTWRNFIPLSDVVCALRLALANMPPGIYNLGAAQSMTLRGAADRIASLCRETLGFQPNVHVGTTMGDEATSPLDYCISKLSLSGFTPEASFEEEVKATLLRALAISP
jgi:nucleoside-diphosphate-sugar epimerase